MTRPVSVLLAHEGVDLYAAWARALRAADLTPAAPLRGSDRLEEAMKTSPPAAVLVDLDVARYEGRRLVQQIRGLGSVPIILAGRVTELGPESILDALGAGATDFLEKNLDAPPEEAGIDPQRLRDAVRLGPRAGGLTRVRRVATRRSPRVIVIGISMGGPATLQKFLPKIPGDFPAGLVVVQHMPAPFTGTLADRLARTSALKVREAVEGDLPAPGLALFAPGGRHLEFTPGGTIHLRVPSETCRFVPCIDVSFLSAARVFRARAAAVILTGMGKDGVVGLRRVALSGGATVAQDAQSAVIDGMPSAAIKGGFVQRVVSLDRLNAELVRIACASRLGGGA